MLINLNSMSPYPWPRMHVKQLVTARLFSLGICIELLFIQAIFLFICLFFFSHSVSLYLLLFFFGFRKCFCERIDVWVTYYIVKSYLKMWRWVALLLIAWCHYIWLGSFLHLSSFMGYSSVLEHTAVCSLYCFMSNFSAIVFR